VQPCWEKKLSASTVNVRLSAIRKLVGEAQRNGILDAEQAQKMTEVPNLRQQGTRLGNWPSDTLRLGGRTPTFVELLDITDHQQNEYQLSAQNWALWAFLIVSSALGRAPLAEGLLHSICEATIAQSV
jgi:hypothetical protein